MIPIRLRHFLHPVKSAKSLYRRSEIFAYTWFAEREFAKIARRSVDFCWCGGRLCPLPSTPLYGSCEECGTYVSLRPPVLASVKALYSRGTFWRVSQKVRGLPTLEERSDFYRADGRLDYWKSLIRRFGPCSGSVLEVGCAPGVLLTDLSELGYTCLGVEADESVADWVRQHAGIEVTVGLFPGVAVPLCDLFLALDVAEHTADPVGFWTSISKVLNPGGIAIIQTPIEFRNYEDPFKSRPDLMDGVLHLYLYTDKVIEKLAALSGLDLITFEDAMGGYLTQFCVLRKGCT